MPSYKRTQIDIENNARMFIRTGDTELEINVKPIEVELEHKKKFKNEASEFREERLNNEKEDWYKRDMVESQLVENQNLVITNRGTGRSHQTILYMMDDPTVISLVRDNFQKNNLLDIYKKIQKSEDGFIDWDYARLNDFSDRVVTFEDWEDGYNGRSRHNKLHIDNVEHYLLYKLGRVVDTFTTGHRAVSGFSNEFEVAEEV
ncbi:hypothetical protein [Mammaliicoccus sp. P-M59]|uniref:hypothetical protein n=1 Tax=Mammaliicoccus sp. P-M59 TaxID=2898718 RepID=UPI001EFAD97A|nr:hypothetical protein [Mammaliicoccus sp. P-M59]